jgi:hypothetical protein
LRPPSRPSAPIGHFLLAEKCGAHLKCLTNAKSLHFSWLEDGWGIPSSKCVTLRVDRLQMAGGTGLAASVGERQAEPLGQGKDDDRRRAAPAEEPGDHTGRRGDVLLASDLIADDAAADGAAGVETVDRLAVAGIDRKEVVVEITGEAHPARRGGHARDQRVGHCGRQRSLPFTVALTKPRLGTGIHRRARNGARLVRAWTAFHKASLSRMGGAGIQIECSDASIRNVVADGLGVRENERDHCKPDHNADVHGPSRVIGYRDAKPPVLAR